MSTFIDSKNDGDHFMVILMYRSSDELPAERLPIKNCVVSTSYRPTAYRFIEKQVSQGRQVYIICPMVEESETMEGENVIQYAQMLRSQFAPSVRISYLRWKDEGSGQAESHG